MAGDGTPGEGAEMKATTARFKIERVVGVGWSVIRRSDSAVVWTGKTFKGARTAHAQRELGIPYAMARRMAN